MKPILILWFSFLFSLTTIAQTDTKYQYFTDKIIAFTKPVKIVRNDINNNGTGTIEFTNAKKQVLRFRLENQKIKMLHGKIAYQLFYYQDEYVRRIETFDINGNRAGEAVSQNAATIEFNILKPAVYHQKKKLIDDAEGNINMQDDRNEKIIGITLLDDKNIPVQVLQPSYLSSKEYWNYCVRMYWP